jgi:hypothetical protein
MFCKSSKVAAGVCIGIMVLLLKLIFSPVREEQVEDLFESMDVRDISFDKQQDVVSIL